jgi:hypothetical protein
MEKKPSASVKALWTAWSFTRTSTPSRAARVMASRTVPLIAAPHEAARKHKSEIKRIFDVFMICSFCFSNL